MAPKKAQGRYTSLRSGSAAREILESFVENGQASGLPPEEVRLLHPVLESTEPSQLRAVLGELRKKSGNAEGSVDDGT